MVVYTRIHLVIVSIHTPTQGVTTSIMYPAQASQFQSTHPRRVWPFCTFAMCSEYVSIHTPTQGVTAATIFCSEFNKFQSTHPRRVWLQDHRENWQYKAVSIHTPTQGVTGCNGYAVYDYIVSIHTPTQGVTRDILMMLITKMFQSTHPRRVWLRRSSNSIASKSFNPHTHAGCDSVARIERAERSVSIHTPTQGVTLRTLVFFDSQRVSIHTPTQGVT